MSKQFHILEMPPHGNFMIRAVKNSETWDVTIFLPSQDLPTGDSSVILNDWMESIFNQLAGASNDDAKIKIKSEKID